MTTVEAIFLLPLCFAITVLWAPSLIQALRVLKCPEQVIGYREVRYPKQDAVRQQIEAELTRTVSNSTDVQDKPGVLDALRQPTGV